jgi:hypothetical protein
MNYYNIEISKFWFVFWIVISVILTLASSGGLFLTLLVPAWWFLILKMSKYYYNDEKLIVETGIFNKKQKIVPLYRIVNITARDNIFNFGELYINDKGQTLILKNVKHSKDEMTKLITKWENAKKENIRNEVI